MRSALSQVLLNGPPQSPAEMKRRAPAAARHRWRWPILLAGAASFLLLVGFFNLRSSSEVATPEINTAFASDPVHPAEPRKKLAFLFLARNRMPLDMIWNLFFKSADRNLYSIYIHARPGFVYDSTNTYCHFFRNRQINDSVQVEWGEASMIDAERILLRKALEDPAVSHFVLLSDSCIPLYGFNFVYEYITTSSKSFVDSFIENKKSRYNSRMYPTITEDKWRKGSQWFVLVRSHAEIVVSDDLILQTFHNECKRDVLPESGRKYGANLQSRSDTDCVPDEHYIQTLLAIKGVENEIERRTLTYTLWKASGKQTDRWHPVTFNFPDASPELIRDIQGMKSIRYETEGRTEWCSCNGAPRNCFLFARKFSRAAVLRLMRDNDFPGSLQGTS